MQDIDPSDPLDLSTLRAASDDSLKQSLSACEWRLKMLRQFVGPYYPGDNSPDREKRPVNAFGLAIDIFQRNLASHCPQVIVETDYEELVPTAHDFETVLNRRIERMKLKEALNVCVVEALVTIGVMCVGVGLEGEDQVGHVFADPVLFPDLILDWSAQSWEEQSFVGHEFLVPLEWLSGEGFEQKPRDEFVTWSQHKQFNQGRDWNRSTSPSGREYEKLVRLRQLYLPRRKKTVLFAVDGPVRDALRVSDWVGPYCGPYIPLAFQKVPGNVFPLPPMLPLFDLDDFANKAFAKSFRQADRAKIIGLVSGNGDDANNIQSANDGDIKGVADPQSVVERKFGGADQNTVNSANLALKLFMYLGGNLDLIGGLAPSSGTVGQDQLLAQSASGRMKDMQQSMTEFETEVVNSIAYWVWEDPASEERFVKRLEGTPYGIPGTWSPETRTGEFYQYNLYASPYSRATRSPSEKAAFLTQILTTVVLPTLPFMSNPNSPVNWEMYYDLMAKWNNEPDLKRLINWPQGGANPEPLPENPGMNPTTTRNYVRRNETGSDNPLDAAMQAFSASSNPSGANLQTVASY